MGRLMFLLSMLFFVGCSSPPKEVIKWKTEIVKQEVPVYQCPKVEEIKRPELELGKIDPKNSDELFKAYPITIIQLKEYSKRLEDIIKEMISK